MFLICDCNHVDINISIYQLTCVEIGLKDQRSQDTKHHFTNSDKIIQ